MTSRMKSLVPPSRKDMKEWIEGFNNAAFTKVAAGYMTFKASNFAVEGMRRELKDVDVRVRKFPNGYYGIPVCQKNNFNWGK